MQNKKLILQQNLSPWIDEALSKPHFFGTKLGNSAGKFASSTELETDLAIIGGGIAGIATAFFALKNTSLKVNLFEAGKIAHGATGHNGGFLAAYFERPFQSLAQEFGIHLAARAVADLTSSWDLLEEIKRDLEIKTPAWIFEGYAGISTRQELETRLVEAKLMKASKLVPAKILISEDFNLDKNTIEKYQDCFERARHDHILSRLQSKDHKYFALMQEKKGCMNSSLFTREVCQKLLEKFADRFNVFENWPVKTLKIFDNHALGQSSDSETQFKSQKVVLCTNGFENITLINLSSLAGKVPLDRKFHNAVRGIVGYMAAYHEESEKSPTEISYIANVSHDGDLYSEEPYFYITRRPGSDVEGKNYSLISVGGPELLMSDTKKYSRYMAYPDAARAKIDNFLRKTYKHAPNDEIKFKFLWHGLMGFTPSGVRIIGPEPSCRNLLYNLGCNGVGLLPSIFGGRKIARILNHEKLQSSIFDPQM